MCFPLTIEKQPYHMQANSKPHNQTNQVDYTIWNYETVWYCRKIEEQGQYHKD